MNPKLPRALEGRDYTVQADGAWVFTREYLLARGTCCGARCTNCPYENARVKPDLANMRPVISMVPSWTETLIAVGANVVGRTRFCIHPADSVLGLPSLGGTKTLASDIGEKLDAILAKGQRPIVILDREENPKEFFDFFANYKVGQRFSNTAPSRILASSGEVESSPGAFEIIVTHVDCLTSLIQGLDTLEDVFRKSASIDDQKASAGIQKLKKRAQNVLPKEIAPPRGFGRSLLKSREAPSEIDRLMLETDAPIFYFIWKNPWMVVTSNTWIGESLKARFSKAVYPINSKRLRPEASKNRYPEVAESDIPPGSILLFSSEPYPFERAWEELLAWPLAKHAKTVAIVDGEAYSWFGVRAIRFLEEP